MQIIYLDISNKGVVPTVYAKQGDVGRKFEVVLTDFGIPYYPPNGSAFSVWYSGSSGDGNYTDIGDKSAFFVSENKITVEMIAQMFSADGAGILCLTLNSPDGNQISSWNIPYICEPVPGIDSEEAKSYYTAFSNAVKDLPYPDASLSAPGKAADAAAVGIALSGKAPGGYGLGTSGTSVTDLNTALNCGFFAWAAGCANAPFDCGMGITINRFNGQYSQILFNPWMDGCGEIVIRHFDGTKWQPDEWLNPPLYLNKEYRTVERHNGKVKYIKKISFGNLPASGSANVPTGISGAKLVSLTGTFFASNGDGEPYPIMSGSGAKNLCWLNSDCSILYVQAIKDCSTYTGEFIIEYTKD